MTPCRTTWRTSPRVHARIAPRPEADSAVSVRRIQRQTGRLTAYEVDAVLEQYRWQAGIGSAATSPSLSKRKRIDWSLVPDEAAFLDSLSQSSGGPDVGSTAASSSRTSSNINIDETRSSLASSVTRPRLPPPVPALNVSDTSLSRLGGGGGGDELGLPAVSPLGSPPISRQPSSGAASTESLQGHPHRGKRGTNGFFGAKTHDARELRMLRSTSGHNLESGPISPSTESAVGASGIAIALRPVPPPLGTHSPDLSAIAPSPTISVESSLRPPSATSVALGAPSPPIFPAGAGGVFTGRSGHPDAAEPMCPLHSSTATLSPRQLRRISTALDAIEVELAKTFARLSGTSEQDEDDEAHRGLLPRSEADDNGAAASSTNAEDSGGNADPARAPGLVDASSSERIDSASPVDVPQSSPAVVSAPRTPEHELFDYAARSGDTVPPSPISPITESDLRGVGTFNSTAPRADYDAMINPSILSDTEELDPFWTEPSRGTARMNGDAVPKSSRTGELAAAITIPPRPAKLAGLSVELDPADDTDRVGQPVQATPATPAPTKHDAIGGANCDTSPKMRGSGPARKRTSATDHLARESFASLRSMGSSFHAVDDARPQSDEDCLLSLPATASSAPPFATTHPRADDPVPQPQRFSVLAPHASAMARPVSLPFDHRPTEELLHVLAAATKRLSASDPGANHYLTYDDVLAIQDRLVQKAAAEKVASATTSDADETARGAAAQDVEFASSPVPHASLHGDSSRPEEGDEAVESLAGLGLDDFASTDFTQPSPQQVDAGTFSDAVEPSSGSSAGKPSPASVRGPTSIAMAAQHSQRTYDSNVTLSSARTGATTSPSDAFEFSSLVTTRESIDVHYKAYPTPRSCFRSSRHGPI